jgi:hypothetical protein
MYDGIHSFDGAKCHEYPGAGPGKAIAAGPPEKPLLFKGMQNCTGKRRKASCGLWHPENLRSSASESNFLLFLM